MCAGQLNISGAMRGDWPPPKETQELSALGTISHDVRPRLAGGAELVAVRLGACPDYFCGAWVIL